ncbi:MAG: hypothetical protein JWQ98_2895 [Chlorobi bacterium]|nr:hypothetical protein [Chlorobiota bacterium]
MNKVFSFTWFAVVCAALLALPLVAIAQESGQTADDTSDPLNFKPLRPKFLLGPRFGGNRNFHSGGFRTISESNCPKFDQGSGFGYLAGLTAEYVGGANWGIIPAVTYESRPGSFTQQLPDVKVLLADFPEPVNQTISTSSDITYQMVNMEVLYKYEFAFNKSFRVSVAAGPAAAIVLGGKITQVQDLNEPLNARFLNPTGLVTERNGRRLVFSKDAEIPGRNGFRASLKGGLQLEIGLFHNQIIMYPGAFYDLGLIHVTKNEDWNLNSLLFQVDFRHAF